MIIHVIWLLLWGMFASYGLVLNKFKSLKEQFDAIIPYQFVVWIFLLILFVWDLFTLNLTNLWLLFGLLQILSTFTKLALWFVFSYGLVTKYFLSDSNDAKEHTDKVYNTLIGIQVPLGIIALILGLIGLFMIIF